MIEGLQSQSTSQNNEFQQIMEAPSLFLKELLLKRRSKNSRYSTSALARDFGLSQSFLSQVINGKRNLSLEYRLRIASRLSLQGSPYPGAIDPKRKVHWIDELLEQENIMKYWYHLAILEFVGIAKNKNQEKRIPKRLGISEIEASSAIERLIYFGFLSRDSKGILQRTGLPFIINAKKSNKTIREFHEIRLQAGIAELQNAKEERNQSRIFQTIFIPTEARKIEKANEMIRDFQVKLFSFLSSDSPDEVYQMGLQLFSVERKD